MLVTVPLAPVGAPGVVGVTKVTGSVDEDPPNVLTLTGYVPEAKEVGGTAVIEVPPAFTV